MKVFVRYRGRMYMHDLTLFKIMVMLMIATEEIMQTMGNPNYYASEMCKCPGYIRGDNNIAKPLEPVKLNGEVNADWIRMVDKPKTETTKDESGHITYEHSAVFVFQDNNGSDVKWNFHTYEVFMQALNEYGLPLGKWSWFHDEANQGIYNKTSEFNETCNKKHALDGESTRPIDYTHYNKENSSYASISCPRFRAKFSDDDFEQTDVPNMFHYSSLTTEPRVKFCAVWKLKVSNSRYFKPRPGPDEAGANVHFVFEVNWGQTTSSKDNYNQVYLNITRNTEINKVYYQKMSFELQRSDYFEELSDTSEYHINNDYYDLVYHAQNRTCKAGFKIPISIPLKFKSYSYRLYYPDIPRRSLDTSVKGQLSIASNPVKYKECFTFEAYPLPARKDNIEEVHVLFRHYPDLSKSLRCRFLRATEITLQVYHTPINFPIGRGQPKGSWRLSDQTTETENRCTGEDAQSSHLAPDVYYKSLPAISDPTIEHVYDRFNNSFWKQNKDDLYPTMLWARFRSGKEIGLCATWSYIKPDLYYRALGNSFLFVAEIMVYDPPDKRTPTILVLSDELIYEPKPNVMPIDQPIGRCHKYRSSGTLSRSSTSPAQISYIQSVYYRACLHKEKNSDLDPSTGERIDGCSVPKFKGYTPTNAPYVENITFPGPPIRYNKTTTDVAKQERNHFYSGCSNTKACVTSSKNQNCIKSRTCGLVIAYGGQEDTSLYKKADEIVIEIYGIGNALKWVAMGITNDKKMGSDYVVECCSESGNISIYNSWNVKAKGNEEKSNIRQTKDQGTEGVVRLVKGFYKDSNIYCKFYIKESFSRRPRHENKTYHFNLLKDSYYLLIASGDGLVKEGIDGNIKRHDPDRAVVSGEKVNLGIRFSPTLSQLTSLNVHGYILTFAWFIFLPIGMFVGRYMKETNRNYVVFNVEVWKFVHIACMCIGYFLIFVSLVCHIYGRFGWQRTYESGFHTTMGWIIECSVVLIMITGYILAKDIGDEGFDWVQFSHAFFGHFVYIGGLFMFYFSSSSLKFSEMPCSLSYWVIAWIIIYSLLQVPIWLHYCWLDHLYFNGWAGISSSVFVFNTLTLKNTTDTDAPGAMARIIMTLVFTIFTIIIGVSIITTVFSSSPCHPIAIIA